MNLDNKFSNNNSYVIMIAFCYLMIGGLFSCGQSSTVIQEESKKDSSNLRSLDYVSDDGNTVLKYYPDGNLKEVSVMTNSYLDTVSLDPLLVNHMYTYQIMEFTEGGKLSYCLVSANDSNWFEYDRVNEKISGKIMD